MALSCAIRSHGHPHPSLEERTIAPSLDTFLSVVKKDAARREGDIWGKRRLAYEIDSTPRGIYAVIDCGRTGQRPRARSQLNLNESVLRTRSSPTPVRSSMAGEHHHVVAPHADPSCVSPRRRRRRELHDRSTRGRSTAQQRVEGRDALFIALLDLAQAAENVAESLQRGCALSLVAAQAAVLRDP